MASAEEGATAPGSAAGAADGPANGPSPARDAAATRDAAQVSPWAPIARADFRSLWLASIASYVGTWVQGVAAVWLMTSLSPSPAMTALVQTASSLPLVLLALPAGALADVVDRRRLLVASQAWMFAAAALLAVLAALGWTSPRVLLLLTMALGVGSAFTAPAWQAIQTDLVPRDELPAAIALGSAAVNGARAIGPAIGGLLVSAVGPPAAFAANAVSFLAVQAALLSWRREQPSSELPREEVFGAIRSGLRFARHSPGLQRIVSRLALFVVGASALWAILPVLARRDMGLDAFGYGVLLGGFGLGAVAGTVALPRLRSALGTDRMIDACTFAFAASLSVVGLVPAPPVAMLALFVAGLSWMAVLSSLNAAAQTAVPGWVRARALAVLLLVMQAGIAVGSAAWGWIAARQGTPNAFFAAAATLFACGVAALRVRLPDTSRADFTPAEFRLPSELAGSIDHDEGPVLVTIEYEVDPARTDAFLDTMQAVRRMRRRRGAWRWGLFADAERRDTWVESFLVESWLDYLRQRERLTVVDREIGKRAIAFHVSERPPVVRYLVARAPIG
ncbi:MAG: MFS transporter [Alphaproteobacteria bacterium]